MKKLWKERRYWFERSYPIVTAGVAAYLFYRFYFLLKEPSKLVGAIIDSALVVCGTLLGFLLTITTIVNAVHTRRMQFIKEQKGYPILMGYLRTSIILNILTLSAIIVGPLVYAVDEFAKVVLYCQTAQIFIIVWSWMASIRFSVIFVTLLSDE